MRERHSRFFFPAGLAIAVLAAGVADAAVKVRQPILEDSGAAAGPSGARPGEAFFVGSVIFSRGNQIVAEIPAGAGERERFVVFDSGFRRRGKALVVRQLENAVFLLEPEGGFSVADDDKLARESETEAAARVIRENRMEAYREFLDLFPESQYRPRIGREMFRLSMREAYPTFPGSVVEGKLTLAETVGRELSLDQAQIVLDRFVIARADERGRYRIEGIPKLEEGVQVKVKVRDPKFLNAQDVTVDLPAGKFGEAAGDLPLKIVPTVLAGEIQDERGAPLPGAEVWTEPYSMEVLTDDQGGYRISRRKKAAGGAAGGPEDEPLFGAEYQIYAYRKGYQVERVTVSAESFRENTAPSVRLVRQDTRQEEVPPLGVQVRSHLDLARAAAASSQGAGPKLNP